MACWNRDKWCKIVIKSRHVLDTSEVHKTQKYWPKIDEKSIFVDFSNLKLFFKNFRNLIIFTSCIKFSDMFSNFSSAKIRKHVELIKCVWLTHFQGGNFLKFSLYWKYSGSRFHWEFYQLLEVSIKKWPIFLKIAGLVCSLKIWTFPQIFQKIITIIFYNFFRCFESFLIDK